MIGSLCTLLVRLPYARGLPSYLLAASPVSVVPQLTQALSNAVLEDGGGLLPSSRFVRPLQCRELCTKRCDLILFMVVLFGVFLWQS